MSELVNVIVFALGGVRMATELRYVREVATLGFVTKVPMAPAGIAGVCNLHGAIVPVLDLTALTGGARGSAARQGDGALLIELDGAIAALRVDQVDEVATLSLAGTSVIDRRGQRLPLVDPRALLQAARDAVAATAPPAPEAAR